MSASIFRNKYWQILVSPFSMVYKWITDFRNHLYDIEYKPSFKFDGTIISVGNLSVGGTGKTPLTEFIVNALLQLSEAENVEIATLSRGYGRKTKGFLIANETATAEKIGDEPFQIYQKFRHKITVSVGEERILAIPSLHLEIPNLHYIILDDAFQHRKVIPSLSIVTTDFNNLFYHDYVLPSGSLRESRKGIKRADAIVVTKCPPTLDTSKKDEIIAGIQSYTTVPVFFSTVSYLDLASNADQPIKNDVLLVSGIANPKAFIEHESSRYNVEEVISFGDHHNFKIKEVEQILEKSDELRADIICTEKDYMRLSQFFNEYPELSSKLYYRPIKMMFLEKTDQFLYWLKNSIKDNRRDTI